MRLLCLEEILTCQVGPAYENNNSHTLERGALVSVAFARISDAWIVSAFRIGADGEPDTDNGEIFVREFSKETPARWLYQGCLNQIDADEKSSAQTIKDIDDSNATR